MWLPKNGPHVEMKIQLFFVFIRAIFLNASLGELILLKKKNMERYYE